MANQKTKTCYVKNGSITHEIQTKGFDVKIGDQVVFFYNDHICLATVVEKTIGEVQITGDKGYILNVITNPILELEAKKDTLWQQLGRVREMLKKMYIDWVETNDSTIDLDKVKNEYLTLKEQFEDVKKKIADWNSL